MYTKASEKQWKFDKLLFRFNHTSASDSWKWHDLLCDDSQQNSAFFLKSPGSSCLLLADHCMNQYMERHDWKYKIDEESLESLTLWQRSDDEAIGWCAWRVCCCSRRNYSGGVPLKYEYVRGLQKCDRRDQMSALQQRLKVVTIHSFCVFSQPSSAGLHSFGSCFCCIYIILPILHKSEIFPR